MVDHQLCLGSPAGVAIHLHVEDAANLSEDNPGMALPTAQQASSDHRVRNSTRFLRLMHDPRPATSRLQAATIDLDHIYEPTDIGGGGRMDRSTQSKREGLKNKGRVRKPTSPNERQSFKPL